MKFNIKCHSVRARFNGKYVMDGLKGVYRLEYDEINTCYNVFTLEYKFVVAIPYEKIVDGIALKGDRQWYIYDTPPEPLPVKERPAYT